MKTFIFYSRVKKDIVVIVADDKEEAITMLNEDILRRFTEIADGYIFISTLTGKGVSGVTI